MTIWLVFFQEAEGGVEILGSSSGGLELSMEIFM